MRTIVVGDIHGCLDEFQQLVESVKYQQGEDRLVLLGDLIDKGPFPDRTVAFARAIGALSIMGNHEDRACRWRAHEAKRLATGKPNPMNIPEARAREWSALSDADLAYLSGAPWNLDLGGGWLAVHGGLLPKVPVENQKPQTAMRLRYVTQEGKFAAIDATTLARPEGVSDWQDQYDGEHNLVVGHSVYSLTDPRIDKLPNGREIWNLDTGCVHGGRLTAMILETRDIVQVQALQVYAPHHGGE